MLRATTIASAAARGIGQRRAAAFVPVSVGAPRLLHHAARSLLQGQDKAGKADESATKQTGKAGLNVGLGASVPFDSSSEGGVPLEGESVSATGSKAALIGSKLSGAPKNPSGARSVSTKGKVTMPGEIPIVDESKHPKGAKKKRGATAEVPIVEEKTRTGDLKERMEEGLASMTQEMRDKKDQLKHAMEDKLRSAGETIKDAVDRTAASADQGASSRAPMQPTADSHLPFDPAMVGKTTGVSAPQQNTSYFGSENRKMLTVTDLIKQDHQLIRLLYQEYTEAIDQHVKQRKVFALIHEMARHNACEELTVYPYLRSTDKIPGSEAIADRSQKEHDAVKVELKEVDRLASDIGAPDFVAALTRAIRGFEAHAGEEEREVLPLMEKRCTRSELYNLGEHFDNSATIVTGRPHPLAPDQGVPAIMAHLTSKPLDYLRDLIAGRSDVIDEEVAAAKKKIKESQTKGASA